MPTKMLRAEDLAAMTGSALVAHYNQLVEENPELEYRTTQRFSTAAAGIRRIEALYSSIKGAAADDGREHTTKRATGPTSPDQIAGHQPGQSPEETASRTDDAAASDETQSTKEESEVAKKAKKGGRKARTTAKTTGSTARGFAPEAKITILASENPRRGAAAERFKLYRDGMTVATYCSKFEGGRSEALVHLRWDVKHGFIKVA